jgi:hypothetical protein
MAVIQNLPRLVDPTAKFRQPIMEMVNGTFGVPPQVRRFLVGDLPQSSKAHVNFEGL